MPSGPDPSRWKRFSYAGSAADVRNPKKAAAIAEWQKKWSDQAERQGWSLFGAGAEFQLQKLDDVLGWAFGDDVPPDWDNDAVVWGIVYHGTEQIYADTRAFLKAFSPHEWALIEEACRGNGTEEALHPSTGAADGG